MTRLTGAIAATPTPFTSAGGVDFGWVEGHLDALRRHSCDGVLIAGTTGEGPSLTLAERKALIDVVMKARGSLAVAVGCGTPSLPDTIEAVRHAHSAGADAALVLPPYYFRHVGAEGLIAYYSRLIEGLDPDSNICLYNIPQVSGVEISDDLLAGLAERHPGRVEGIKDSSGIMERTLGYLERYPNLHIWPGGDRLTSAMIRRGAPGVMSATASWAPDLVRTVLDQVASGPSGGQARLDSAEAVGNLIDPRAGVKYLCHLRFGLPATFVRPPLLDASTEQESILREAFERLGLEVKEAVASPTA
ncbi:MAG: dihydrodipicolinate synthase family protein [Dehalococcoidia bacterium]